MKTSQSWMCIAAGALAGITLLTACESPQNRERVPVRSYYIGSGFEYREPQPVEVVVVEETVAPAPAAPRRAGNVTELAFPTGDKRTSSLLLRQTAPVEIRPGVEYDYTIDVINLTSSDLQNVVVTAENFSNLTYVRSNPAFSRMGQEDVAWLIGDLPANATKQIVITAKANAVGTATNCLSVAYANVLCIATPVVQPALQLTKTATPEICSTCEEIKLTYVVKNTGSGIALNTVVNDTLPAGLTTVDGKNTVTLNAGDLAAGAERAFNVTAKAAKAGTFGSAANATAGMGLTANSPNVSTVVKEPALAVTCEASDRVFIGREATYKFTVRNTGNCAASGATVRAPVPAGTTFTSADNGGTLQGGSVVWTMPSLAAGQSASVSMRVRTTAAGTAPITATASATCVPAVTTNCSTTIAGIPAILLEVVDTVDPVEIGQQTTFIVTATNQGSADDNNVKVVGTLPAEMEYVSGTGASQVTVSGQTVTMTAVPKLSPGQKAEWRITVRAKSEGDSRTRWEMTSEQFKQAVIETESTNLFK